uniref:Uncharacterized protein n=1 Tax=Anguilla anguilla TaxID=7936 RepID=A0A0E9QDD9_ANGAN
MPKRALPLCSEKSHFSVNGCHPQFDIHSFVSTATNILMRN